MLKPSIHPRIHYQNPDNPTGKVVSRVQQRQQEVLAESGKYILLKKRKLIEVGKFICPVSNPYKQLGKANGNIKNTITRELVMRIKKGNSDIFAENEDLRKILKVLHTKYSSLMYDIQAGNMSDEIEANAKEFYLEFKRLTKLGGDAESVIHIFSWAGEEKYNGFEYCCHCWIIVVCIINMIKLGIK